jgi:hypothetical protein
MTRRLLGAAGVLLMGYAVAGALADPAARRPGYVLFLAATLVGHDLVLLPLALATGWLATRWLPPAARGPVRAGLFASAVLAFVAVPLHLGPGEYLGGLGLALGAIWIVAGGLAAVRLGTSPGMRQDNFPHPVSDPEAEGLPEYADDDSNAWDEVHSPREADGPDPAPLPADHPLAVDRFGTTAEEARHGESLDYKLARESTDPAARPPDPEPPDENAALSDEVDEIGGQAALVADTAPVDPHLDSAVSMYDRPDELMDPGAPIGRLVEPDEGVREDDEKDAVAYDSGAAGGGPSPEEAAMHEVREP